jgi:hypothetical protein
MQRGAVISAARRVIRDYERLTLKDVYLVMVTHRRRALLYHGSKAKIIKRRRIKKFEKKIERELILFIDCRKLDPDILDIIPAAMGFRAKPILPPKIQKS